MSLLDRLFPAKDAGTETGTKSYPFFIKAPLVLVGIYVFFNILLILQDILVPVCFAVLIGVLLNPLAMKLMRWRIPKVAAITISLLLAACVIVGVVIFISSQIAHFTELAPQFKAKGQELLRTAQHWISSTFNVPVSKQNAMLRDAMKNSQAYIGQTLGTMFNVIGVVVLLPIYTFLVMYYKPLFLNFFYDVFDNRHGAKVSEILNETKGAVQSYIQGLMIEMVIVAVMNAVALLLLGVKYAILLGIIGAVLNLIPYVGGVIAIALPVAMSLLMGDKGFTTPLLVVASYTVIQFIDNNLLVPRIVSSKVDVNAFVTIIVVLLGGALWGVSGMFLAVPFVAVCKIIFDRIDSLKPWGKLLGVKIDMPPPQKVVTKMDAETLE